LTQSGRKKQEGGRQENRYSRICAEQDQRHAEGPRAVRPDFVNPKVYTISIITFIYCHIGRDHPDSTNSEHFGRFFLKRRKGATQP
jgi:hypothetical protein